MHARELVELAALVSTHGPVLITSGGRLSATAIEQYWCASKCRLDRWGRALKDYTSNVQGQRQQAELQWGPIRPVLEEILTGEILTRVWTAVLCAYDRWRSSSDAEPVARSVWNGHLEARHRALGLMVYGPGLDTEEAVLLNRLRRRTERWTDFLLGYLLDKFEVAEFTIDLERANDFADDLAYERRQPNGRHAWPLMLTALRGAFKQGLSARSPNAESNARLASAILGCFPPELFDSTGLFRSLWLTQLSNTASDAQGMIEDLLRPEPAAPLPSTPIRPPADAIRWNSFRRRSGS